MDLLASPLALISNLSMASRVSDQLLPLTPLAGRFVACYQVGFVNGRMTTDQIFTLRQVAASGVVNRKSHSSAPQKGVWNIMDETIFLI